MKHKLHLRKGTVATLIGICLVAVMTLAINYHRAKSVISPLKVHFIDVEGDATLLQYTMGDEVHYGMIDVGQRTEDAKNAAVYFAGVADKAKQERVLDFCIITHAHRDHYYGLRYLKENNIKVKKLYVNSLFYEETAIEGEDRENVSPTKRALKKFLKKKANKNGELVSEDAIVLVPPKSVATISYDGLEIHILGSTLEREEQDAVTEGYVNMHSMMCTVDYSNYKYIFMGDVYQDAYDKIVEENLYHDYLVSQDASTNIICKLGHHGRRDEENYKENSEKAIYNYIVSGKYKKLYAIANKHYGNTKEKFANSTALQKMWNDKKGRVYCIDGYEMNRKNTYIKNNKVREKVQNIWALTSGKQ